MAPSRGLYTFSTTFRQSVCLQCRKRAFGTTATRVSGHSRWSKIKHDKGKNDAARDRQRSQFAQEIATSSKLFGPEPERNPRLANLVAKAKREGMPKAGIEAAIARGQGRSAGGAKLESLTVEAMLKGNVAVIVECETDSRPRTLASVRLAIKDAGGSATSSAYLFEKQGRIVFEKNDDFGMDQVLDMAVEAGATDVEEDEDGAIVVFTEPASLSAVGEAISGATPLHIATSEIVHSPKEDTMVALTRDEDAQELTGFVEDLHEKESSIQAVTMNVAQGSLSDESWRDLSSRLNT